MHSETEQRRNPASEMMSYGYRPDWSEGSIKPPVFMTSTFVFGSAAEGKRFFEVAYGLREPDDGEETGLIYSRLNNPSIEILENRLCRWEQAEQGLSFSSGMSAITTTMLTHLRPGDVLLHSAPLYGGTDHIVNVTLPEFGIITVPIDDFLTKPGLTETEIKQRLQISTQGRRVKMIYLETPANPTNSLRDISAARRLAESLTVADDNRPLVVVDNTFLGPIWQKPLDHGADISIYSATKHMGGHGDLIAGAAVGTREALEPVAAMRTFLGTMLDPHTAWLLTRSLETLNLRMHRATQNAEALATMLIEHPVVQGVRYLGLIAEDDPEYELYRRQCLGPGSMIAVYFKDEAEAFCFIDALDMIRLAVSLGGTESLVEHPATMTHAGVDPAENLEHGVTEGLVRLSIGVEHIDDLVTDISNALDAVAGLAN